MGETPGLHRWRPTRRQVLLAAPAAVLGAALAGDRPRPAKVAPDVPRVVLEARAAVGADGRPTDETSVLQEALDRVAAAGGGTLVLRRGAYGLSTSLAPGSRVRLLGEPGATLVDLVGNLTLIDLVDCEGTVVEGLRMVGRGNAVVHGRAMVHGTRGTGRGPVGCRIVRNVMVDAGTCGVALDHARDVVVEQNTVWRPAEHGIYLSQHTSGCRVLSNSVDQAGAGQSSTIVGIKLAHPGCRHNIVERNVIRDPLSEGIVCDTGARQNWIVSNTVVDAPQRGVRINPGAPANNVLGNLIRGAGAQSCRDHGAVGSLIFQNTIDSPDCQVGIQLDEPSARATVQGNYVLSVSADGWGISADGRGHRVTGNYVAPEVHNRIRVVHPS